MTKAVRLGGLSQITNLTSIFTCKYFFIHVLFLPLGINLKPMDAKLTLSFSQDVVNRAKAYAADNNISLSRLIEHLLTQVTNSNYKSIEDYPIADWVAMVAEGDIEYKKSNKQSRKAAKDEFFASKK